MMKKILLLSILVVLLMPVFFAVAQCGDISSGQPPCSQIGTLDTTSDVGVSGGTDTSRLVGVAVNAINWFSWFVALAAVVMGLYSGFLFVTARDNSAQLATARNTMLYAIIGIAVAILSFSIINISKSLIGF